MIELRLETTNDTEIRAAVVFAEGIFKHESIVIYPHDDLVSNNISVELCPPKDMPIDLHVKTLVGYRASSHFHVFELSRHLPRFAMFGFVRSVSLSKGDQDTVAERGVGHVRSNSLMPSENGFNDPYIKGRDRLNSDISTRNEWDQIYSSLTNTVANENFQADVIQPQSYVVFRINDSLGKVVSDIIFV